MTEQAYIYKDDSPITIYYYYDFTDTDLFCALLEKRFHETGHKRRLRFIEWNCYKEEPGRDGDIFFTTRLRSVRLRIKDICTSCRMS